MPMKPFTIGPSPPNMTAGVMRPQMRLSRQATTSQVIRVPPRSQPRFIMMTMMIGTTSRMSASGLTSPVSMTIASAFTVIFPKMMKSTAEMPPAMREYGSRVRTTSLTLDSCVRAEAIVVSEIGARLSPKSAPEMIAPVTSEALQPI